MRSILSEPIQVIMLPTDKASSLFINKNTNKLVFDKEYEDTIQEDWFIDQHLYLVSDAKIEDGDWCLLSYYSYSKGKVIYQVSKYENNIMSEISRKKIEATTDNSLWVESINQDNGRLPYKFYPIPQIPQSFVEAYAKSNGTINEVQVEMEYNKLYPMVEFNNLKIKTRPDNTVIIHINQKP